MWPLPFHLILDMANQHIRDLEREADQDRLAAIARHRELETRRSRQNPVRIVAARTFRTLSDASHAFSQAACSAATRLEGKVA
jgi:hypothetical protein